jgi:O-antigen ligase
MPFRLRRLLMVLCLTGTLAGLEGIVQRLAGSNKLLFLVRPRFNQDTEGQFGPYANRNNAAEYFNLLWPVCAGLAFLSAQAAKRDRREGLRKRGTAHRWLVAGAMLMGACPIISSSRGGSLIALGMLPVALVVMLSIPQGRLTGGKVGLGLLFVAAIQVAVIFGWDALEQRFEDVFTDDLGGRLAAYKNAEGMARDYQLLGSGADSFASLYYLYRADPDTEWCAYLHNDWLESRITLGWIGFALLLALLAGTFAHWFLGRGVPLPGLLAALLWLAMAGCLVHARFDFPFRVHSVATVFLLYSCILSCSSRAQK